MCRPRELLSCALAWCLLSGLALLVPSARTIEVHEDVNEGPIGAHLRLNVSTSPPSVPDVAADERDVNDPPPPPALPALAGSDNFSTTTFPSNHRQHSGASIPTTSSATPEAAAGRPPTTSPTAPTTAPRASGPLRTPAGLSSFRAAGSNNDVRAAQHQISGYRKRQLYASAVLQRNTSRFGEPQQSSDGQFAKEFVPSPEVVPFFHEDSSPMAGRVSASPGNFVPTSGGGTVDAPYPAPGGSTADGQADSKWYAGLGLPGKVGAEEPRWDHQLAWHRHRPHSAVQFPREQPVPVFPSPKGKWKWIPDGEDDEQPVRKPPSATPFSSAAGGAVESSSSSSSSSSGSAEERQPYFGKYYLAHHSVKTHPYSFERTPAEAFPSPPTTFSGDGTTAGGNSSEGASGDDQANPPSTTVGSTDVQLVGKEDGHFKSVSPWKKIIHVLSAAIPIGLLISALTPQVVYINPNATQPPTQLQTPTPISGGTGPVGGGVRQRSLGPDTARMLLAARGLGTDPLALVKLFHKLAALERDGEGFDGSNRLPGRQPTLLQGCDWRLLCQLARQGMLPGSDALHKTLWKIASETPPETLGQLGLEEVFRTIRSGECDLLQRTCDQDATRDEPE